jgi:ubiquinone/menaquinone biosynthesis C-methylase UbiE
MPDLMDQYRCPTGEDGRKIAASMNRGHEPLTLWGLSHLTIKPDWAVLDVGCGGGKTVHRLAKLVPKGKVYGLDYSADMVQYSKEINQDLIAQNRVEIAEGTVEKIPFPEDFFDLVTAIETYYFWNNFTAALEEINRVLKPDGRLLLVNEMIKDGKYEVEHAKLIEQTHVRLIPVTEIQKAVWRAGFVAVQVFTKVSSPWNAVLAKKQ